MKKLLFALIILCIISSCKKVVTSSDAVDNEDTIILQQGETGIVLSELETELKIDRNDFSIQFYLKPYDTENKEFNALQIAVLTDESYYNTIQPRMTIGELYCFGPGSGMALHSKSGYDYIAPFSKGHHYLMYENENNKSCNLIEKADGYLHLEFPIKEISDNENVTSIADTNLDTLFFVILNNKNRNYMIDEDELKKLKITFK